MDIAEEIRLRHERLARREQEDIIPMLTCGREAHHPSPEARFADPGATPADTEGAVTRMRHLLKTPEGKARYTQRKSTVKPVFGIIKNVLGFGNFCYGVCRP